MAKANKQFDYLVTYYPASVVRDTSATQRKAEATIVQAGSVTRALAKFKRTDEYQGSLIVAIAPDSEGRYDVGPVTVDLSELE